ncbi:hypothetical protein ACIB24_20245 [Spongisporangium articulatum]|uniref:Uncharacterized protein n=1 Tax=Spongisporangium articulatum TaxID=3362603 RepID=A0ABW8AUV8_9ACTN
MSLKRAWPVVRAQAPFVARLVLVGVLLAAARRGLYPLTRHLGDSDEVNASADVTLALLGIVAGILTATWVLVRPTARPVTRCASAVLGSLLGGLITWPVLYLFGGASLLGPGVLLAWPIATALGLFTASLLPWTSERFDAAGEPHGGPDGGPDGEWGDWAQRPPSHAR